MHTARHLAAAAKGDGARVSEANSNSKMGRGEVTKRLRWLAMVRTTSGKLGMFEKRKENEMK
jgi:hypothetical protein